MGKGRDGQRLEQIDLFGSLHVNSLEEYFQKLNQGQADAVAYERKLRKRMDSERAEEHNKLVKQQIEAEMRLRMQSEQGLIKWNAEMRRQAEEKVRKDEQKKRLEDIKKATAEQAKALGIQTPQQRRQELAERHESNLQMILNTKALGQNATAEQKAAARQAKAELMEEERTRRLSTAMNNLIASMNNLNAGIGKYASYSAKINARLQGYDTRSTWGERLMGGPQPFSVLETRLTNIVGVQPYFKTEQMLDNLSALVEAGIASNVEQRAFLQTAKDDIATTFGVANASLLRIVRLQQSDSTAARLGMEAYLTRFLNGMFENTEYLSQTFDNVSDALVEASALAGSSAVSTEFEYVVQKWLGSLTSVGLSEATATSLAQALGYLGSGNIEALGGSGLQNLLVMAAAKSGQSFGDLLSGGLTAETTDALMASLVQYMVGIGQNQSNVVKSQLASTFGLTVSDLVAASNLAPSLEDIQGNYMTYSGMYDELSRQMLEIPGRLNVATMIDNLWANMEFGLASNIAKNPALAAIWKVTDMIGTTTGGINIPSIMAMGTGFDLNATVDQLVKLGVVGVSSLGMIGDLVGGLQSTFGPQTILSRLGIAQGNTAVRRGTGVSAMTSGYQLSQSSTVGNSSGEDIQAQTLQRSEDESREKVTQEQDQNDPLPAIRSYLQDTLDPQMVSIVNALSQMVDMMQNGVEVKNDSITSQASASIPSLYF